MPRLTLAERLWARVQKGRGCWEWQGPDDGRGYGQLWANGSLQKAHRVSWQLTFGPIPSGLFVLHKCDNPPCVRPDHLFLGDDAANSRDKVSKGRSLRGERNPNAILTDEQAAVIRGSDAAGTALAARFGVSQPTISMIRSGKRR